MRYSLRTLLIAIAAVPVTLICMPGWPFNFCYHSICDVCGAWQGSVERQLPWTSRTFRSTHRVKETLVSRTLRETGAVGPHEHRWLFARGAGNGVQ